MFETPVQAAFGELAYLVVPLRTRAALKRIRFRIDIWDRMLARSSTPKIIAFTSETDRPGSTAKMRVFAPDVGVLEEPATERACSPLASYLAHYNLIPPDASQVLALEQGAEVDRPSFLHVALERSGKEVQSVRVGGQCVTVGEGVIAVAVTVPA
jgi:trans-2,3-dihydro-3-hydroxyanthranilate isomerase